MARLIAIFILVVAGFTTAVRLVDHGNPQDRTVQAEPTATEWTVRPRAYVDLSGSTWRMALAPPLAFVGVDDSTSDSRHSLAVVDVTDPGHPHQIGYVAAPIDGAIAVGRGYVYGVDEAGAVHVIDVRSPRAPRYVGAVPAWTAGSVRALVVGGNRLFAMTTDGRASQIAVLDLSDPEQPAVMGKADMPHLARGFSLALASGYLFAPTIDGVTVFDVQDPTAPRVHANVTLGETVPMLLYEDWLFTGTAPPIGFCAGCWPDSSMLKVLHVVDGNPTEVAQLPLPDYAWDFSIVENRLLTSSGYSIDIIDISDPTQPQSTGHVHAPGIGFGPWIEAVDPLVLTTGREGLYVLETVQTVACPASGADASTQRPATSPAATSLYLPLVANGYDERPLVCSSQVTALMGGRAMAVAAADGLAFVARGPRVLAYRLDPVHPLETIAGQSSTFDGNVTALALLGPYLLAADDAGSVSMLAVADGASLRTVAAWHGLLPIHALAVRAIADSAEPGAAGTIGHAYVATNATVTVLELRTPPSIEAVGTIDDAHGATVLETGAGVLVAVYSDVSLRVFDIGDPASAVKVGEIDPVSWLHATLAISGDVAYAADLDAGLTVLDLADPRRPALVWSDPGAVPLLQVAVEGQEVYGLAQDGRILVWDVQAPRAPRLVASSGVDPEANGQLSMADMTIHDGQLVMVGPSYTPGAVHGVDVRAGSRFSQVWQVDDLGDATDIAVAGTRALVADAQSTRLVDLDEAAAPVLVTSHRTPGGIRGVALTDQRGFATWARSRWTGEETVSTFGLDVIDAANPIRFGATGSMVMDGPAYALTAHGAFAYALLSGNLVTVDGRDPTAPRLVGEGIPIDDCTGLAVVGDDLFAATRVHRIARYHLGDEGRPILAAVVEIPGPNVGLLQAAGPYLLAEGRLNGRPAVAVLEPGGSSWPSPVATWRATGPRIERLAGDGRRGLFIEKGMLSVFDLSRPTASPLMSQVPLRFDVRGLVPFSDHIAFATGPGGLRLVRSP